MSVTAPAWRLDVFESYAVTLIATMPASLIGIQFARLTSHGNVLSALTRGLAASRIVQEVRCQLETMPGILKGEVKPDYVRAVTMLTRASIRGMIIPAALPVCVPSAILLALFLV